MEEEAMEYISTLFMQEELQSNPRNVVIIPAPDTSSMSIKNTQIGVKETTKATDDLQTLKHDRIEQVSDIDEKINGLLREKEKLNQEICVELQYEKKMRLEATQTCHDLQTKLDISTALLRQVTLEQENLTKDLREIVECPVCLAVPTSGPIFSCPNGHLVCSSCRSSLCPTCRVTMGEHRCLLASTVVEGIKHECRHRVRGCQQSDLPVVELLLHQETCAFRPGAETSQQLCGHVLVHEQLPDAAGGAKGWSCSHCTFTNPASETVCGMCFKSKAGPGDPVDAVDVMESCPNCTYYNNPGVSNCLMCGGGMELEGE